MLGSIQAQVRLCQVPAIACFVAYCLLNPMRMKTRDSRISTKCDGAAALARIRENQRRSRERRKEYTQYLEQRLGSFERLGVAATQEVQEAGRKVARENVLLRSLLMVCGVTEEQTQEYLQSHTGDISAVESSAATISRLLRPSSDRPMDSYISHTPLAELDPGVVKYVPPKSRTKEQLETERLSTTCPNTPEFVPEAHQSGGDTGIGQFSSCEDAATLIASLGDHPNIRDVRSQLGCDSESTCIVKNMSIFEILDKV